MSENLTIVDRSTLDRIAVEYLTAVVESECVFTFENNDSNPTTFEDYLADAIAVLERVRDGGYDEAEIDWIANWTGTVSDLKKLATFDKP